MNEADLIKQLEQTKEELEATRQKLQRTQLRSAEQRTKGRIYEAEYQTAKEREQRANDLVMELLERQRELNVMLNRANMVVHRAYEAMALTSGELTEMAKALPEPKQAEWSERVAKVNDRVAKINDLFKKTGMPDDDLLDDDDAETQSLSNDEIKRESEQQFARSEVVWSPAATRQAEVVQAELVPEKNQAEDVIMPDMEASEAESADQAAEREMALEAAAQPGTEPQRRSWWSRIVAGE